MSPHHSAREMIEVVRNRDFAKLFQKSVRKVSALIYVGCIILRLQTRIVVVIRYNIAGLEPEIFFLILLPHS